MSVHLLTPLAQSQTPCSQTAEGCGDPSYLLVIIGVLLLLAPIFFFVVWRNRNRQVRHMGRGEVYSGIAHPGPQGLLTAPHGGGQCLWWQEKAEEHTWKLKWENNTTRQVPGEYTWREKTSYEPFLLVGSSGQQLLVHPAESRVEGAERVVKTTVKAPQPPPEAIGPGPGQVNNGVLDIDYEVFALAPGKEVHVLGAAPTPDGRQLFRPETEKAKMVISTEPAPDFTAKIESQRRWALGSLLVSLGVGWPLGIGLIVIASL
jgi:hypothetical protein